ncbi:MAG: hypothetical protein RR461_08235 [Angelakisella sp.]
MKKILWILVAFVMLLTSAVVCYAQDETSTIPEEEHNQIVAGMQETVDQQKEEIQILIGENKTNQAHLEQLYSLYGTWTAVMGLLFVLFGIVLPIALPFIISHKNNVKIDQLKKQLISEISVQKEKSLVINNAMALASSGDYWVACECLKKAQTFYPEEACLKVYLANYSFRALDKMVNKSGGFDNPDIDAILEHREEIETAIENYKGLSECKDIYAQLMARSVFYDSFIHEMFFMIGWLYHIRNSMSYHKIVEYYNALLKIIRDELHVSKDEELFEIEQTHSFIMIYKQVCAQIAKMYAENHHCNAKEKLMWTIKLLKTDDFRQDETLLKECEVLMQECVSQ